MGKDTELNNAGLSLLWQTQGAKSMKQRQGNMIADGALTCNHTTDQTLYFPSNTWVNPSVLTPSLTDEEMEEREDSRRWAGGPKSSACCYTVSRN